MRLTSSANSHPRRPSCETAKYRSLSALLTVAVLFSLFLGGAQPSAAQSGPPPTVDAEYAPGHLLVQFRPWVSSAHASQILAAQGASRKGRVEALGVDVLRLPPGLTVERAMERFARMPEVLYAEPNYVLRVAQAPTEITDQWALAKIEAVAAWDALLDPAPAVLAIVDTGIDRNHPELDGNIWSNPDEKPGDGIDNDDNGLVDDTWGWDFVSGDNDPMDDYMHGTAVASVAAGEKDGAGVAGVCHWCQLVSVKVLDASGAGTLDVVANGITYAADLGANVINLSLGAGAGGTTLQNAVNYAWEQGAVVVAAAGNNGAEMLFYPAAYANAMAVASTNSEDYRSCFSNYYQDFIDVAAPGEAIWTAIPNNGYGTYSGTSLAAPHVTGLAGLLFSQDPRPSNEVVRSTIEATTEDLGPAGTDAFFGTGRINADRAVRGDESPTTPAAGMFPRSADASGYAHARKLARDADGTLHLVWHDRDGAAYQIRHATWTEDGATWSDPEVVFESMAETFHPALALGNGKLYVAFPTKDDSSLYRIQFTSKSVDGDDWAVPTPIMGGSYDAVRPDLHVDEAGVVHAVAASYDNAPYVYYASSNDEGASWSQVRSVNVTYDSRYADVYASNGQVYIAGRSIGLWMGLFPELHLFTVRSTDGGQTWTDLIQLESHLGLFSSEYGASLAGVGDQLRLIYEHAGSVYARQSTGGASWSAAQSLGTGAWPSVTQAADGQAWAMWARDPNVILRHYTGTAWEAEESLGPGTYPNLKDGVSGGRIEWALTHCSGAPFRLMAGSRTIGANEAPVVADLGGTTAEDTPADWMPMVSDADGDALTCTVDATSAHGGEVSVDSGCNSGTYSPAPDFYGDDTFAYTACDPGGLCDAGTVTFAVTPVGDLPVAKDDTAATLEDTRVDIPVLDNDSDPDDDPLSVTTVSDPLHGVAAVDVDATVAYTPDADYCGGDSFGYTLSDGKDGTDAATVTVDVTCVNDPPVAGDDAEPTDEDTPVTIDVLVNDSDPDGSLVPSTVTITSAPGNGSASVDETTGAIAYTPDADWNGTDNFGYQVCDDGSPVGCDAAIVTVTVAPVNDPPDAVDDTYSTAEDKLLTVLARGVLGNDSDAEGDVLTVTGNSQPISGTVAMNADGSFNYTPDPDFAGEDSFTYTASDGNGGTDTATVTVTVSPVNDPPVASFTWYCPLVTCNFDASASLDVDGSITSYVWDLGDGATETAVTGTYVHTYDAGGTYTVALTVTDDLGATGAVSHQVVVQAPAVHIADLDGFSTKVRNKWNAEVTILVHDQNEERAAGATVYGTWSGGADGGDSCTTNGDGTCTLMQVGLATKIPSLTFAVTEVSSDAKAYDPSANHDLDRDSDGTTIVIYLEPPANLPPTASFTYDCAGLACTFDAAGSSDVDGTITSYDWYFGDGGAASGAAASHTYAQAGVYSVELAVTDNGGATGTDTQLVPVGGAALSTMHVAGLTDASALSNKKFWKATVTILVENQDDKPIAGATVEGTWSSGVSGTCITGDNGGCSIASPQFPVTEHSAAFTVNALTHTAYSYEPLENTASTITIDSPLAPPASTP